MRAAILFLGRIVIKKNKKTIKQAKRDQVGTVFWTDGSWLDNINIRAAVIWKNINVDKWKKKSAFLGKKKEILDAKL